MALVLVPHTLRISVDPESDCESVAALMTMAWNDGRRFDETLALFRFATAKDVCEFFRDAYWSKTPEDIAVLNAIAVRPDCGFGMALEILETIDGLAFLTGCPISFETDNAILELTKRIISRLQSDEYRLDQVGDILITTNKIKSVLVDRLGAADTAYHLSEGQITKLWPLLKCAG
ncbi:MAG: hypothetical protein ABJF50_22450 [Paracoccaceae bacterium]